MHGPSSAIQENAQSRITSWFKYLALVSCFYLVICPYALTFYSLIVLCRTLINLLACDPAWAATANAAMKLGDDEVAGAGERFLDGKFAQACFSTDDDEALDVMVET